MNLKGCITAMITPFNRNGAVDYGALRNFIEEQITAGISALLPMGTTGESPTVDSKEHLEIIQVTVEQAAGRVPVIAGTGSNCTAEAIELSKEAKAIGASCTLQVAPYYNKPNQEGFYRHFSEIADQSSLPVLLYNVPGRSGKNIEVSTILWLAQNTNIIGVKEASGSLPQMMEIAMNKPEGFLIFSGDDNLTLPMMVAGADGVISVASNIIPSQMMEFINACLKGDFAKAKELHYHLYPIFKGMFIDTNPIPVKTAMAMMGKIPEVFRLPLCPMSDSLKVQLQSLLKEFDLI